MIRQLLALILFLSQSLSINPVAAAKDSISTKIAGRETIEGFELELPDSDTAKEAAPTADPISAEPLEPDVRINPISPDPSASRLSFASFEQLKSLCAKSYSSETVALCTMESGEFVFSEDLTIPENLTVVIGVQEKGNNNTKPLDVNARIPGGVTVTLKGKMAPVVLTVDGELSIEAGAYLSAYQHEKFYLTVNGSISNKGQISADGITGLDYIEQKNFINSRIYITESCSSNDELLNLLEYNTHYSGINVKYYLTYSGYADFAEDAMVPYNTNLILSGDGIVRDGCRLTVKGDMEINDYFSSVCLTVEGELKNYGSIYLRNYSGNSGRLKLQKGGSYLGDGRLMLYASGASLDVADMLPGFDLSQFTRSTNGSFTQLVLTDYEETWEDEEISSFQELKEMVESGSNGDILRYTGPNPLVIEEDLELNSAQDMHIYPTDIVVPEGVTFTVNSFFSCHNLTVHGTMNSSLSITLGYSEPTEFSRANPNTVIVDGALNLYGEEFYSGYYYPATLATEYLIGDENIHRLGGDNMVFIIRRAESEEDIRKTIYEAQNDYKEWKEYCPSFYSDFTLTEDLTIPRGCSLDLYDGTFTVPEGVTLSIYGKMELRGGDNERPGKSDQRERNHNL